ncbi:MAG: YceI family protein [Acidimicrobiales bacterium]
MTSFVIVPERSTVIIAARSSVGPINWHGTEPEGQITCEVLDGAIDLSHAPTGHIAMRVERLSSGNSVYDAELLRRIDARRFPVTTVTLDRAAEVGTDGRFEVVGRMDLHGVSRPVDGVIAVELEEGRLLVTGEKVLDIRDFDIPAPHMLLLNIYPTVRVHLVLEARPA